MGALADLLDEGKIRMAGISNATVAQIDEAKKVLGGRLVSVQNEFSLRFRSSEGELEHCEALGIAFFAWSPLGGIGNAERLVADHPACGRAGDGHGVTAAAARRWPGCWPKGDRVIPIPGSSRPETAVASAEAAAIELTAEEVAALDAA